MAEELDLVLTDAQNWASRSHRELYEAVHNNNDPGQTGEIGAEWGQFGAELTESARVINERVASSESGWTGDAADSARAAIKLLSDWVTKTAETAVVVGTRVQAQSQIMENARASMPEPVEFNWDQATGTFTAGGISGLLSSAADVEAANSHARALHEHAVTVMTTMENESRGVDQTTPKFTAPFNPVTGRTEEPQPMMLRTVGAPTLGDAQAATMPSGTTAPSAATAYAPSGRTADTPVTPAYQPAAASYTPPSGTGGYAGGSAAVPMTPVTPAYRPEGTTAAAAAAAVPVANSYTPPSYTPPSYTPPGGYTAPSSYTTPSGTGYVPPSNAPTYQQPANRPANPGYTPPTSTPGYIPPTSRPGAYTPPQTKPGGGGYVPPNPQGGYNPNNPNLKPPVPGSYHGPGAPGMPGGGAGGAGGAGGPGGANAARFGGGGAGGFGGGGAGGFGGGGGGAGGFGPGGSGGAGGQLAAGGSTGAVAGNRGPVPTGGFGPTGPAGPTGAPMGAGAPMAGAPGGQGAEDKERRSAAYIRGEDIFEVPGENLPPSVIGGAKPGKKKGEQP